jgi:phosphate-selective porin OprO/OprP
VKGQGAENLGFKVQYDFAGGDADFKDVYMQLKKVPVLGSIKVGHFKEPFSLEELTSSNHITFLERSVANAFAPSRNTGVMLGGQLWNDQLTWALGAFRETDGFGDGFGDSEYNVTARATGVPWYGDEGRRVLHLGLSYSHEFRSNDAIRFASKPEAHLSPVDFVDTLDIASDGVDLLNPELALVYGPFSLQAEYTYAAVEATNGPNPDFDGYYAMASYFLTGEHRRYDRSKGAFVRVSPAENFSSTGGWGAWEVALRYSVLDLDDDGISGGELDDWTLGINWYLNPFARIMFNYILADLEHVGDTQIFQTRFQLTF